MKPSAMEIEKTLQGLEARFATMTATELETLKAQWSRKLAKGQLLLRSSHEVEMAGYATLTRLLASKRQQEAQQGRTPEQELTHQARELARQHGVSAGIARKYLERQASSRRDIKQAPAIEATPGVRTTERQDELGLARANGIANRQAGGRT